MLTCREPIYMKRAGRRDGRLSARTHLPHSTPNPSIMQAIASQTFAAAPVATRTLSARRSTKALSAPR